MGGLVGQVVMRSLVGWSGSVGGLVGQVVMGSLVG